MPVRIYNRSKVIDGEIGAFDNTTSTENTVYDEEGRPWTLAPNQRKVVGDYQNLTFISNATTDFGTTTEQTYAPQIRIDKETGDARS